jgi:hypothetical protein
MSGRQCHYTDQGCSRARRGRLVPLKMRPTTMPTNTATVARTQNGRFAITAMIATIMPTVTPAMAPRLLSLIRRY